MTRYLQRLGLEGFGCSSLYSLDQVGMLVLQPLSPGFALAVEDCAGVVLIVFNERFEVLQFRHLQRHYLIRSFLRFRSALLFRDAAGGLYAVGDEIKLLAEECEEALIVGPGEQQLLYVQCPGEARLLGPGLKNVFSCEYREPVLAYLMYLDASGGPKTADFERLFAENADAAQELVESVSNYLQLVSTGKSAQELPSGIIRALEDIRTPLGLHAGLQAVVHWLKRQDAAEVDKVL